MIATHHARSSGRSHRPGDRTILRDIVPVRAPGRRRQLVATVLFRVVRWLPCWQPQMDPSSGKPRINTESTRLAMCCLDRQRAGAADVCHGAASACEAERKVQFLGSGPTQYDPAAPRQKRSVERTSLPPPFRPFRLRNSSLRSPSSPRSTVFKNKEFHKNGGAVRTGAPETKNDGGMFRRRQPGALTGTMSRDVSRSIAWIAPGLLQETGGCR